MAREASAQREKQEQSIKARKNELFVEEQVQTGPQKKLRDYLKDTPAAPLSKQVKMMLWGSAAPVVLLFVAALLVPSRSRPKPPEESIIPVHAKPALAPIATRTIIKPPAATKSEGSGPGAAVNPDKPAQDKEKPKKKSKAKPKAKPKPKPDEAAVAQNSEGRGADTEKPKDNDKGDGANDANPKGNQKKSDGQKSAKDGSSPSDSKNKATTPDKSKKRAAPFLTKKPKVYNPAYPSRNPSGEKKADPDSDAGFP
jgi:hypothetical protein